jgi:hypothetical protein
MRHSTSEGGDLPSCGAGRDSLVSGRRPPGAWQGHLRSSEGRSSDNAALPPHASIEPGAPELRIRDRSGIYRAFYYSRSPRGILVFHAFVKKTQAAPIRDLDWGKKRLKELLHEEA